MNTKVFGLAVATLGTIVLAAPASAQMAPGQVPPCGPRTVVVEQLQRDFSESIVSRGLASNGTMLELLVSPHGTWTMLISLPNGNSCFGAAGEMWEELAKDETGATPSRLERPASLKLRSF
jgi:hypothetical protein